MGGFTISGATKLTSKAALEASTKVAYYIAGNGDVYIKLISRGGNNRTNVFLKWTGQGSYNKVPLSCTTNDFSPSVSNNQPPVASFDNSLPSSLEEGYSTLYVKVNASDPDGDAISVMLKIDGVDIRQENGAPYEWGHATTPNPTETLKLSPGEHTFEATVTDSKGAKTTVSKTITVVDLKIAPVVEIISPAEGAEFNLGEDIVIEATASDQDGAVTKVNFKLNGGYHSQDLNGVNGVYTSTYLPTEAGTYVLGARAFDNEGESTEVSINVEIKLITGTSNNVSNEFSAYPNPTTGVVHLSKNLSWELYSAQGIKVKEGKGTEVDLSSKEKGMYLLKTDEGVTSLIHQ